VHAACEAQRTPGPSRHCAPHHRHGFMRIAACPPLLPCCCFFVTSGLQAACSVPNSLHYYVAAHSVRDRRLTDASRSGALGRLCLCRHARAVGMAISASRTLATDSTTTDGCKDQKPNGCHWARASPCPSQHKEATHGRQHVQAGWRHRTVQSHIRAVTRQFGTCR
jgi:hypothetical protein